MLNLQLDHFRTFHTVVDLGSLEAAASQLHITPSAISQRIRAMERELGSILLVRSKPIHPTATGELVLQAARQITTVADTTLGALVRNDGAVNEPVTVPIVVNSDSLSTWFLAALAALPQRAEVQFDLRREDESHSTELLRDGSVMGAVTSQRTTVPGCTSEALGIMRYVPVAAPSFIAEWMPDGVTGAALGACPAIDFDRRDPLQDIFYRKVTRHNFTGPRHRIPGSAEYAAAIRNGFGWGQLPEPVAKEAIARGEVIALLEPPLRLDMPLYWQRWALKTPLLDALSQAIRNTARQFLLPFPATPSN